MQRGGAAQAEHWWTRTWAQNAVAGVILFLLPGVYLALTGLGAGGGHSTSETVADVTNIILYGVFCGTSWLGGIAMNLIGPRWTMSASAIGYMGYTGGLWYFDSTGNPAFAYTGGALEGLCAGLLWSSAGAIAYSYATEARKATYVTMQWMFCVTGSTIAAVIALFINLNGGNRNAGAPVAVYGALLSLQGASIVVALLLLVRPSDVTRSDGSHLADNFKSTFGDEFKGIASVFRSREFWLLFPAMFSGEIALAQQSSLNAYFFNRRTRSLNNVLFNFIQIPACLVITGILDGGCIKQRKTRSLFATSVVGVLVVAVCSGQIAWLKQNKIDRKKPGPSTDWRDPAFGGAFTLYILNGAIYGTFQMTTQYVLSSFTNDPLELARYSGAFRTVNALGMMISFIIERFGLSHLYQMIFQVSCYSLGIAALFVVAHRYVSQTNNNQGDTADDN